MSILNFPEIFIDNFEALPKLYVHDYKMTTDVFNSKVNMCMNTFSFLQIGHKKVHFADSSIEVNENQSILIKNGNCLVSELVQKEEIYFCKLLFFSSRCVEEFLKKNNFTDIEFETANLEKPYFVLENDEYIKLFVKSLDNIMDKKIKLSNELLQVKFEEIMLYLTEKYRESFIRYIKSMVTTESDSAFRKIVDQNIYTNLKLEELAFLCHMSLSSFKRHFTNEYGENPGKWFQKKRLLKAKELLMEGKFSSSDIYQELGYNNLSNFSHAFKAEFGLSPNSLLKQKDISHSKNK